ncbi:MAG: nucleotidyltransferase family protein [Armatimonadetes bacterium]|nr:nucleotidyltransferase family protein [Armatimonadota bacterium]
MVSSILLAAGKSRRMGSLKQLLLFQNQPLVLCALTNLAASSVDEIVLVLGHDYHKILNILPGGFGRMKVAINRHYETGLSSSIRCGLNHIARESEALLVALGDQPLIGPEIPDRLISRWRETGKGILYPTYRRRKGHPVLFSSRFYPALRTLSGDVGAKALLAKHRRDALGVPVKCEGILVDMDVEADLSHV